MAMVDFSLAEVESKTLSVIRQWNMYEFHREVLSCPVPL